MYPLVETLAPVAIENMGWQVSLNSVILLMIAVLNTYSVYIAHRTEKNTNSMKDALVAATAKASLAQGLAAGTAAGKAQGLAQGRVEGAAAATEQPKSP